MNSDYSLKSVVYIIGFDDSFDTVFIPENCGRLITDKEFSVKGSLPNGFLFAFGAFGFFKGEQGIYAAVHNPNSCLVDMELNKTECSASLRFEIYAENIGIAGNNQHFTSRIATRNFTGSWQELCDIYRSFLSAEADWYNLPSLPRPDWFDDIPIWLMDWMPMEEGAIDPLPASVCPPGQDLPGPRDWIDNPIRLAEELGTDIGYHLYNWHKIPFNNDYPHYFPPKDGFAEGLKELQAAGVRVFPYINALLWDTKDCLGEDKYFTAEGYPGCAKHADETPEIQVYASHEPDGSLCQLAAMCPSHKPWQQKVGEIVKTLEQVYHTDGVYLDQISAVTPPLCFDKTHSHPLGGGGWWVKEYWELLKQLGCSPEFPLISECNCENYTPYLHGFLSWMWIRGGQVPAFPYLYANKISLIGRNTNGYMKQHDLYSKYHIAESLLYCQSAGWINSDVVNQPDRMSLIKSLTAVKTADKEFLRHAFPVSGVKSKGGREFTSKVGMNYPETFYGNTLLAGAVTDGKQTRIYAANIDNTSVSAEISYMGKIYTCTIPANTVVAIA